MARVPAAAPREYAATNDNEHFAEMAAAAWEIVSPPTRVCVDGTPSDRLRDRERDVPGTAGFVSWYLRTLRPDEVAAFDDLSRAADALAAPYRAEMDAMWKAVEARRLPNGDFQPFAHLTMREYLEALRAKARASDRWLDRVSAFLMTPSLMALSIAGR